MHRKNPLLDARCEILLLALKKQSPAEQPTNQPTNQNIMMIYGNQQNKPKIIELLKQSERKTYI